MSQELVLPGGSDIYQRLVREALRLLESYQTPDAPQAVAVLACLGFSEGTVVGTAMLADNGNDAHPLAMVLSVIRTLAATETCKDTRDQLQFIDAALQLAIAYKLAPTRVAPSLH